MMLFNSRIRFVSLFIAALLVLAGCGGGGGGGGSSDGSTGGGANSSGNTDSTTIDGGLSASEINLDGAIGGTTTLDNVSSINGTLDVSDVATSVTNVQIGGSSSTITITTDTTTIQDGLVTEGIDFGSEFDSTNEPALRVRGMTYKIEDSVEFSDNYESGLIIGGDIYFGDAIVALLNDHDSDLVSSGDAFPNDGRCQSVEQSLDNNVCWMSAVDYGSAAEQGEAELLFFSLDHSAIFPWNIENRSAGNVIETSKSVTALEYSRILDRTFIGFDDGSIVYKVDLEGEEVEFASVEGDIGDIEHVGSLIVVTYKPTARLFGSAQYVSVVFDADGVQLSETRAILKLTPQLDDSRDQQIEFEQAIEDITSHPGYFLSMEQWDQSLGNYYDGFLGANLDIATGAITEHEEFRFFPEVVADPLGIYSVRSDRSVVRISDRTVIAEIPLSSEVSSGEVVGEDLHLLAMQDGIVRLTANSEVLEVAKYDWSGSFLSKFNVGYRYSEVPKLHAAFLDGDEVLLVHSVPESSSESGIIILAVDTTP